MYSEDMDEDKSKEGKVVVISGPSGVGKTTISKEVVGNLCYSDFAFEFMVTFSEENGIYPYRGNGVANGMISSGDSIMLAHGQSITIKDIPKDTQMRWDYIGT